jgi:pimeloyl-ACP methyl ester carboxylesterase
MAAMAQLSVVSPIGLSIRERTSALTMPWLVAYGAQDVMLNAYASFAMTGVLPDAKLVIYSDVGHGL